MEKTVITPLWLKIKNKYKLETNGSQLYGTNFEVDGELDEMCMEFIDLLGELTKNHGYNCIIENLHLDLWKDRCFHLLENSGLLEPYVPTKYELEYE